MDRPTAEIYHKLNAPLNEAAAIIGTIQAVWLQLMQPIVRQHPALDPGKGVRESGTKLPNSALVNDACGRHSRAFCNASQRGR